MPAGVAELRYTSIDAGERVRQTSRYVERGGFNPDLGDQIDPIPGSGSYCGYNDEIPYPGSQDVNDALEAYEYKHREPGSVDDEYNGFDWFSLLGALCLFLQRWC